MPRWRPVCNETTTEEMMRILKYGVPAAACLGMAAIIAVLWTGSNPLAKPPDTVRQGCDARHAGQAVAARQKTREQILNAYANLPLTFVENRGQTDSRVRYYAQGPGYGFYLTRDQVALSFVTGPSSRRLPGARGSVIPARFTAAAAEESEAEGVALALRVPPEQPWRDN